MCYVRLSCYRSTTLRCKYDNKSCLTRCKDNAFIWIDNKKVGEILVELKNKCIFVAENKTCLNRAREFFGFHRTANSIDTHKLEGYLLTLDLRRGLKIVLLGE